MNWFSYSSYSTNIYQANIKGQVTYWNTKKNKISQLSRDIQFSI